MNVSIDAIEPAVGGKNWKCVFQLDSEVDANICMANMLPFRFITPIRDVSCLNNKLILYVLNDERVNINIFCNQIMNRIGLFK